MHLSARQGLTYTQHGVPKYSQRFKDVLYRFYQQQQKKQSEKQHVQLKFSFHRIKLLGVGAHSMVNIVMEQSTRALFAQKVIKKQPKIDVKQMCTEIKIHMYLSHENIIKLYHCYSDLQHVYLLMELGQQSLFAMKNRGIRFNERQIAKIIKEIVKGVSYMHGQGLVHGDLKLQNVVMTANGSIKICDFGYTHKAYEPLNTQIVGTLQYLAPQYVEGRDSGFKRDTWAVGMILYQLITGKNPLQELAQDQKWLALLRFSTDTGCPWQMPETHHAFQTFLASTLCKAENRATCIELQSILQNFDIQDQVWSAD